MKKLLSLLLALGLVFALAACGTPKKTDPNTNDKTTDQNQNSDLEYVKSNGTMVIGITLAPPMNFEDENGDLTGFDTELTKMVCEKLGVTPKFTEIDWNSKEVELQSKTIDAVWNGLTITADRQNAMEITEPYLKNIQVVLMKDGNSYESTASLIGKSVAAEQGSAGEDMMKTDENLKQANYVPTTKQSDCLMELQAGTVDAAILDLTLARHMTGEGSNYTNIVIVDRLGEEEYYGVAFRKGSDICAAVNQIIDEMRKDGSLAKLAEKYDLELPDQAAAE